MEFIADYPEPSVAPGEVLVRVHRAGICATDLEIARGYLRFAGVPGHEFVGTVTDGPAELRGQRVVAEINCACGACDCCAQGAPGHCRERTVLGIVGRDGAFAERLAVPARNCHLVPPEISDEQAVFVEPLAPALELLRQHQVAVEDMITATFPLERGVEALAAAADRDHVKVLLVPGAS